MSSGKQRPPADDQGGADDDSGVGISLPTADIAAAYVVVSTPAGRYRRRVFLSLHSATAAVERARVKGQPVRLVLCRLTPVAADRDLSGEWSA